MPDRQENRPQIGPIGTSGLQFGTLGVMAFHGAMFQSWDVFLSP
jgi:hypothetical protein